MSIAFLTFFAILFGLVVIMRWARVGALVAFLIAGIIAGPYVMNIAGPNGTWAFLGDLGMLFLWFSIGLGISMRRLWGLRRTVFGLGLSQVMMVAIILLPVLNIVTPWPIMGCVMAALILAMSSTSQDMQMLVDKNQLNTPLGRQTYSILLFQDLLAIPLLMMLPIFAGRTFNLGATAIDITVMSLTLLLAIMILGRLVINPLFKLISRLKSREVFLIAVMLNIIVWATVADYFGMPAGLGAFLAGMLMSETIYRHQVNAEMSPYSMLFLAFFFVSMGMGLDLSAMVKYWHVVIGAGVALVAIKFCALYIVARVRRVSVPDAAMMAILLAQGSEFGLLILQTMKYAGIDLIPGIDSQILIGIIVVSMMASPAVMFLYERARRSGHLASQRRIANIPSNTVRPSVIICGFGRVGQIVAQIMRLKNIPYVAIDLDVAAVMIGRTRGFNVVYGDATNADVLREFGLRRRTTRAVVVALDNVARAGNAISSVHTIAPRVPVFARARNLVDAHQLRRDGAAHAMPETLESSFILAAGVLNHLGTSKTAIMEMLTHLRADEYAAVDTVISDK